MYVYINSFSEGISMVGIGVVSGSAVGLLISIIVLTLLLTKKIMHPKVESERTGWSK